MRVEFTYIFNSDMHDKIIVVYGTGRIFERYWAYLNLDRVAAIVDMSADKQGKYIENIRIEPPEKITSLQYDYIVIFSDIYFENAKINLIGNHFVEEQKIVSWRIFFNIETINEAAIHSVVHERKGIYQEYIEGDAVQKVIDIGDQQLRKVFLTNESCGAVIDNLGKRQFDLYKSFYRNCFAKYREIEGEYNTVFLWGNFEETIGWNDLFELAQDVIIWTVPYSHVVHKDYGNNLDKLEKWGKRQTFLFADAVIHIFTKMRIEEKLDCEIFVVSHKKYNVIAGEIYKPICVGDQYKNEQFYLEHTGDNIAYLNDRINECTALYWIWKNTDSAYVGMNHYRRYFYNSEVKNYANYLKKDRIAEIFEEGFDFILPEMTKLAMPVRDNIRKEIGREFADRAFEIVNGLIKERVPAYFDAFEYVMSVNVFYKCHLFVTKRALLNSYCEWLFSFIIDAAERMDVSYCDAHTKRAVGYFAEAMLTVWLLHQDVKVKEMPIIDV